MSIDPPPAHADIPPQSHVSAEKLAEVQRAREELRRLRTRRKDDEAVLPWRQLDGEVHTIGKRPIHAGTSFAVYPTFDLIHICSIATLTCRIQCRIHVRCVARSMVERDP